MNKIKAIMHNKVLYQLMHEEKPKVDYIIIDEFAREARYYDYIKECSNIQKNIPFYSVKKIFFPLHIKYQTPIFPPRDFDNDRK